MAQVEAPGKPAPALSRGSLARLAAAALVVGLGLAGLWQAGVLFQRDDATTTGAGGEIVSLEEADASIETPNSLGLSVGLRQGDLAPDFEFSAFDGRRLRLSDFRGRPVLLNFWATWCIPCKRELPAMEALLRRHEADGLAVVAVNAAETYGPANRFLQELGVQLTAFAYDPKGDVVRRYGVQGLPTSYFIDAEGVVRRVVAGEMSAELMESLLQATLAAAGS